MKKLFGLIFSTVYLFATSGTAHAAKFEAGGTLLGQVREDASSRREVPLSDYFNFGLMDLPLHLSLKTDARYFRDLSRGFNDFDLYQGFAYLKPVDVIELELGRQFLSEGFSAGLMDGLRLGILPPGFVDLSIYLGVPRNVERGDFNRDDGLLTGFSLRMKGVDKTNLGLGLSWRKERARISNQVKNDEVRISGNFSRKLGGVTEPFIFGLVEYDITAKVLDVGSIGMDIYPSNRIALGVEFGSFNTSRRGDHRTPSGILVGGRTIYTRFSSTLSLIRNYLDFEGGYSFQWVKLRDNLHKAGHLIDASLPLSLDVIGMNVRPTYYFMDSFGGRLHGVKLAVHEDFNDRIFADALADFSFYNKITGSNTNASSTGAWAGVEILKNLRLSAGFEYNRNAWFDRDIRSTFKIEYGYGHEI